MFLRGKGRSYSACVHSFMPCGSKTLPIKEEDVSGWRRMMHGWLDQ